jgi:hypothetical protein
MCDSEQQVVLNFLLAYLAAMARSRLPHGAIYGHLSWQRDQFG